MTDHDYGSGEIKRGFERIEHQLELMQQDVSTRYHELANKMNAALGPVSELRYRCEQHEKDMGEVAEKLRVVERAQTMMEVRAASIAGGMTVIVFVIKIWLLGK